MNYSVKIDKVFQSVTITLNTEEAVIAVRDALFGTNDQICIKIAKEINQTFPRRRSKITPHKKEKKERTVCEAIMEALNKLVKYTSCRGLYNYLAAEYKLQTIAAACTDMHQAGTLVRVKGEEATPDRTREVYFYGINPNYQEANSK